MRLFNLGMASERQSHWVRKNVSQTLPQRETFQRSRRWVEISRPCRLRWLFVIKTCRSLSRKLRVIKLQQRQLLLRWNQPCDTKKQEGEGEKLLTSRGNQHHTACFKQVHHSTGHVTHEKLRILTGNCKAWCKVWPESRYQWLSPSWPNAGSPFATKTEIDAQPFGPNTHKLPRKQKQSKSKHMHTCKSPKWVRATCATFSAFSPKGFACQEQNCEEPCPFSMNALFWFNR